MDGVKVVGGGANSPIWIQTIANVFACPALLMTHADSSAGAGLYALVGLGEFSHFGQVPQNVLSSDTARTVPPEANLRAFYKDQLERYRFVQEHVSAISHFHKPG
jgi:sugar (pentulose or hexulose) kinase